jgi:ABC-type transport system involved in cytochrome c biogenesis permease component
LQARLRDVLIPILLFPSAAPVAIAATKCTGLLFNQIPLVNYLFWLLILGSFFVIFGLFGYLVFNQIVEE